MNNNPRGGGGNRAWPLFIGLPIIVALAVAAVILIGSGAGPDERGGAQEPAGSGSETQQPQQSSSAEKASSEGGTLDSPALGDEGAPVVMVEYSDYQ